MKAFVTALGICALLLASGPVYATAFIWQGDGDNARWGNADNWDEAGYPDDNTDTATITSMTTYWPKVNGTWTIDDLTMGGSADLDVNGYTLTVDVFTINDSADILLTNSSASNGKLSCASTSYTPANVAITISATGAGNMVVEIR